MAKRGWHKGQRYIEEEGEEETSASEGGDCACLLEAGATVARYWAAAEAFWRADW